MFYFVWFCLSCFSTTRTNSDPLKVLSTMAPKQDQTYARGRSKSVAPSARLIIGSDDERDPEYVPPSTSAPSRAARAPRATPKTVASGVVTASQSDEERTLTGTPSGSVTNEERALAPWEYHGTRKIRALLRFPHPPLLQRRPRLMRLTVQTLHPTHHLRSTHQPLTSQTDGVSTASIKFTPTPSS